jgi:hypothetical protein
MVDDDAWKITKSKLQHKCEIWSSIPNPDSKPPDNPSNSVAQMLLRKNVPGKLDACQFNQSTPCIGKYLTVAYANSAERMLAAVLKSQPGCV